MRRLEVIYVWYGGTVATLLLLGGADVPHRWLWFAAHVSLAVPAALLSRFGNRLARYVAVCLLVPAAFVSLGVFLPDLTPEPFHWRVFGWDLAVGGAGVTAALEPPAPWLVEVCQVCYATFYFLPLTVGIVLMKRREWAAVEHAAELVIGGFLLSYLGYLVMPTLPPYRFLSYAAPLEGWVAFPILSRTLYDLEVLRQDCMPSGHTMMTLVTCGITWRHARGHLLWLVPVSFFLILGTLVLRLHWFVDLVVAVPFVGLAWWLFPGPHQAR